MGARETIKKTCIPAVCQTRAKWERDRSYQASKYGGSLARPPQYMLFCSDMTFACLLYVCIIYEYFWNLCQDCETAREEFWGFGWIIWSLSPLSRFVVPLRSKQVLHELDLLWSSRRALNIVCLACLLTEFCGDVRADVFVKIFWMPFARNYLWKTLLICFHNFPHI